MTIMSTEEFTRKIEPFIWSENDEAASVRLTAGDYLQDVFYTRLDDGVVGSGYDWTRLALRFLEEQCPHLLDAVEFDPDDDVFYAYSKSQNALREFVEGFKDACEDRTLILDLLSRANPD